MNIREELQKAGPGSDGLYFNPVDVVPDRIYAVLINEVVPEDPGDDFYGGPDAAYLTTALPLFQEAGIRAGTILDILSQGIYLTNAVKMPKPESTVAEPALSRKRAVVIPQFKGNYADGRRGKKGLQHDKQKDGPQKCGAVRLYL